MVQNSQPSEKIKALIVDDKHIIHDMFRLLLGFHGHHLTFVDNPHDAIPAIQKEKFDIVFCDIVMPGKNGIDLLQEMKSVSPQLPVVMMSGFTVDEKRRRAKELGAAACLDKPFEREEFSSLIQGLTGKKI